MSDEAAVSWIYQTAADFLDINVEEWHQETKHTKLETDAIILDFLVNPNSDRLLLFCYKPAGVFKSEDVSKTKCTENEDLLRRLKTHILKTKEVDSRLELKDLVVASGIPQSVAKASPLIYFLKSEGFSVGKSSSDLFEDLSESIAVGCTNTGFLFDFLTILEDVCIPFVEGESYENVLSNTIEKPTELSEDPKSSDDSIASFDKDINEEDVNSSVASLQDEELLKAPKELESTQLIGLIATNLEELTEMQTTDWSSVDVEDVGIITGISTIPVNARSDLLAALKRLATLLKSQIKQQQNDIIKLHLEVGTCCDNVELPDAFKIVEIVVNKWTQEILKVLEKEALKHHSGRSPIAEIEFWKARNLRISIVYEQLSSDVVKGVLDSVRSSHSRHAAQHFDEAYDELYKLYDEARSNAKFLSKLERYLRGIQDGPLDSLPSFITRLWRLLRQIWCSTGFYHRRGQLQALVEGMLLQLITRWRTTIEVSQLWEQHKSVTTHLKQAIDCFNTWKEAFKVESNILQDEKDSSMWEIEHQTAFQPAEYAAHICNCLCEVIDVTKGFIDFLGPEMRALTRDAEAVDELLKKVLELKSPFELSGNTIFEETFEESVNKMMIEFRIKVSEIEDGTVQFLNIHFANLRSASDALTVLSKFRPIESNPTISQCLMHKFDDILRQFDMELLKMRSYFMENKNGVFLIKLIPPVAACILWSSQLEKKLLTSISMLSKADQLFGLSEAKNVHKNYQTFAKELQDFQYSLITELQRHAEQRILTFLKSPILLKLHSEDVYYLNIDNELSILAGEIRYLSEFGYISVEDSVLSVLFRKGKIMSLSMEMERVLKEHQEERQGLSILYKKLFGIQLNKLNKVFDDGCRNICWASMTANEYVKTCQKNVDKFREFQREVKSNVELIQTVVEEIREAELVRPFDWERNECMDIEQLYSYFEEHRVKVLTELQKRYNSMTLYIKNVEEVVFKGVKRTHINMNFYYTYWEQQVYQAIKHMIFKGIASYKALFATSTNTKHVMPLINVVATSSAKKAYIHGAAHAIESLQLLFQHIVASAKYFSRWMDGTCTCISDSLIQQSDENASYLTFHCEVSSHPVICNALDELNRFVTEEFADVNLFLILWKQFEAEWELWDMRQPQLNFDASKSNSHYIEVVEEEMRMYNHLADELLNSKTMKTIGFIQIDMTSLLKDARKQALEWSHVYGSLLHQHVGKSMNDVYSIVDYSKEALQKEICTLEDFEGLRNIIDGIKNKYVEVEIGMKEVDESYHTLVSNGYPISNEELKRATMLRLSWEDVKTAAINKTRDITQDREKFSPILNEHGDGLKASLSSALLKVESALQDATFELLEDGGILLDEYKELLSTLTAKNNQIRAVQKFLQLPTDASLELHTLEKLIRQFDSLYTLYNKFEGYKRSTYQLLWISLDLQELYKVNEYEAMKRYIINDAPELREVSVFSKIEDEISNIRNITPLLEQLANESTGVDEWKKIFVLMNHEEFNLQKMTLGDVMSLGLQSYEADIQRILVQAHEEIKLRKVLERFEEVWEAQLFEVVPYMNGDRGYIFRSNEEILSLLEDNLLQLQSMHSSTYSKGLIEPIQNWESKLSGALEAFDLWIQVQKKWMYLENIFINSKDIRVQLPEESKLFDKVSTIFCQLMFSVYQLPNITVVGNPSRSTELSHILLSLEKCQKSLTEYLECKRLTFPRFFFVSDDELLNILGCSNLSELQSHIPKLFDNCAELLSTDSTCIEGLVSAEGEKLKFVHPQMYGGTVEVVVQKAVEGMEAALLRITKRGLVDYARETRVSWIRNQLGMVSSMVSQIWWTYEVENAFKDISEGKLNALSTLEHKMHEQLYDLTNIIRSTGDFQMHKKLSSLIILDVHSRDIIERLIKQSVFAASEFGWESQLRFYWDIEEDQIYARQCIGRLTCGSEYQGLKDRLAITPLTEKCILTLTTALTFHLGGSPAGPAGTGKTETVKELAKSLAFWCIVQNCGEGLDFQSIGRTFSGLVQTGSWGCFDEFNRINTEVLSVIATQIKEIQLGLSANKKSINLVGREIPLVPSVGIFVTMNPGYAGRSELPENLKLLFRPVAMVAADLRMISDILLTANGFKHSKSLAAKITMLFKLAKSQLTKQNHYDFALRAMKAVLVSAGAARHNSPDVSEEVILIRSLKELSFPKLLPNDAIIFEELLHDVFTDVAYKRAEGLQIKTCIERVLTMRGYNTVCNDLVNFQVEKTMQLFDLLATHHSVMILGPTGSGKSVVISTIAEVHKQATGQQLNLYYINPKAQDVNQLYGSLDTTTRDWTDGILSKTFREVNQPQPANKCEKNYIVFDGDVDPLWIENMNSVMDDNKLLTLSNGERIFLENHARLLFEVSNLNYASPATVSRCGMLYMEVHKEVYISYFHRWVKFNVSSSHNLLQKFFVQYIPPIMEFVKKQLNHLTDGNGSAPFKNINEVNKISQFCALLCAFGVASADTLKEDEIENLFILAIVWSIGATLNDKQWPSFDVYIKELSNRNLPKELLRNYCFDAEQNQWIHWDKKLQPDVLELRGTSDVFISTSDSCQYGWILKELSKGSAAICFVGSGGIGKSAMIQSAMCSLETNSSDVYRLMFSGNSTAIDLQRILFKRMEKRLGRTYGPLNGKQLHVFIDDLNIPKMDKYGTKQPLAALKFMLQYGCTYMHNENCEKAAIVDLKFITAMSTTEYEEDKIDERLTSQLYHIFVYLQIWKSIYQISRSRMAVKFGEMAANMQEEISSLASATADAFERISEYFKVCAPKHYYTFTLGEISKVLEGVCHINSTAVTSAIQLARLWRNEFEQVFANRLPSIEDRQHLKDVLLPEVLRVHFPNEADKILERPLIYMDLKGEMSFEEEAMQQKSKAVATTNYREIASFEDVHRHLEGYLSSMQLSSKAMPILLFEDMVHHLISTCRLLSFPNSHALFVAHSGSGARSILRFTAFIKNMEYGELSISGTKLSELKEEFFTVLSKCIEEPQLFVVKSSQMVDPTLLKFLNEFFSFGDLSSMFSEEEKEELVSIFVKSGGESLQNNAEMQWKAVLQRISHNLHLIVRMSPESSFLKEGLRLYPYIRTALTLFFVLPFSEESFDAVASNKLMAMKQFEGESKEFSKLFVKIHMDASMKYAEQFNQLHNRRIYFTSKTFFSFVDAVERIMEMKKKEYGVKARRLTEGLQKIIETAGAVEIKKEELAVKHEKVRENALRIEAIIRNITEKNEIGTKRQAEAAAAAQEIKLDNELILREKEAAEKELEAAMPALDAAARELENLNKRDIAELKAFATPPRPVMSVCMCVAILRPLGRDHESDGWNGTKIMLNDVSFLRSLLEFKKDQITDKQIRRIQDYFKKDPDSFQGDAMLKISKAGNGLLTWVKAMVQYHTIAKLVEPKRRLVSETNKRKELIEEDLKRLQQEMVELDVQLKLLREEEAEQSAALLPLRRETEEMEKRLLSATKLIDGLSSEQLRWTEDLKRINEYYNVLRGNAIAAAAFLTYAGPFNFDFRKQMLLDWETLINDKKIPVTTPFGYREMLSSDIEVERWFEEGLPGGELSVQNAIITINSQRFPLCIDPQMQAITWIKQHEAKNGVAVKSVKDDYARHLEICIQYGRPLILEGIENEFDPLLTIVMDRRYIISRGEKLIQFGGKTISYGESFKLYLMCKQKNPSFNRDVMGMSTTINYYVTINGLEEQLLNVVVELEVPELQKMRSELIAKLNSGNQTLEMLEADLLRELSEATGSLLDNEELISTLQHSKTEAAAIVESIHENHQTVAKLEELRQVYQKVAERGSVLFFALLGLSNISNLYEYSLSSYLATFEKAVRITRPDADTEAKTIKMVEKVTQVVYDFCCIGIFEKHKLLFSFQLTLMIMEKESAVDKDELEFFLKGNSNVLNELVPLKEVEWINDMTWRELVGLSNLNNSFDGLIQEITIHEKEWHQWVNYDAPEEEALPGRWKSLSHLQKLLILRIFRVDRVSTAVKQFIVQKLGDYYSQSPGLNYEKILLLSSPVNPVLFILTPGSNPQVDVQRMVETLGPGLSKFRLLSLGQGIGGIAQQQIEAAFYRGHWVMLQNCHLYTGWLKTLESIIRGLNSGVPHKDYRLWLTSFPIDDFPLEILQNSLKVVTSSPDGLKPFMTDLFARQSPSNFNSSQSNAYGPLLYAVSFLHVVMQERTKYGKVGWNISYDFSESDVSISYSLVERYCLSAVGGGTSIAWEGLRELLGGVVYGGRVFDNFDQRVLKTYLSEYIGEFLLNKNSTFYFSRARFDYILPTVDSLEGYQKYIKTFPSHCGPEVFGLHPNAEIRYLNEAAKELWNGLLRMRKGESISQQTDSDEMQKLMSTITSILTGINVDALQVKQEAAISPFDILMMQEIDRFRLLSLRMVHTLEALQYSLNEKSSLTPALSNLMWQIKESAVPEEWLQLAPPSLKPLPSWVEQYKRRHKQYIKWLETGFPSVIWLSGLHQPDAVLSAIIQTTCRRRRWKLGSASYVVNVTNYMCIEDIPPSVLNEDRYFIQGLYLEGASWDIEKGVLIRQPPHQLITEMPLIEIIPTEEVCYTPMSVSVPVYITQKRNDARGLGWVFNVELPTVDHPSMWILQGIALLLNTDN